MDHATLSKALFTLGLASVVLGTIGAMLPWKSRHVSTPSIQRRVYWTCSIASAILVFVSQLPDWRSGLIITFAVVFFTVGTAWRFTSHLKVRGRIYAASNYGRQPDPPPALRSDSE